MRFRDYIPTKLLLLFSITILVFSSCIQDKNPLDPGVCPTYVKIYAMLQSQTGTRGPNLTSWSTSLGNSDETKISSIRVFAIRDDDGGVEKNQLFSPGASNIDEKLSPVSAGANEVVYAMQMLILTGHYEFILIANEDPSWNLGSADIKTKDDLLNQAQKIKDIENMIITPAQLADASCKGIPMVGSQHFDISYAQGITYPGNPQHITPRVNLERTLAKVEVTFTNKMGTEVYPMSTVKSIASHIMTAYQHYNLLPEMTNPVTVPDKANPVLGKNKFVLPITLPSATTAMNEWTTAPYIYYMAERPGSLHDALNLSVTIETSNSINSIPFNLNFFSKDENDFNIRRNYYYKIRCIVKPNPILEIIPFSTYWTAREFRMLIPYPNYNLVLTDYDKTKNSEDNYRPGEDVGSLTSGYEVKMVTNRISDTNVGCTLVSAHPQVDFTKDNTNKKQVSLKIGTTLNQVQTIAVNGTSDLSEGTALFYIIENLPEDHQVDTNNLIIDTSGKRMYIVTNASGAETGYYWYTISK